VHYTEKELKKTILDFLLMDDETARQKFNLGKDMREWSVAGARKDLILDNNGSKTADFNKIVKIDYRPFDTRYTYYTGRSKGFHCRPRSDIMRHFIVGGNIGLVTVKRQPIHNAASYYFVSSLMVSNGYIRSDSVSIDSVFPLYLYNADNSDERVPNLNEAVIAAFSKMTGLSFTAEKTGSDNLFSPIDLLDYIYAVLYSNNYRAKYREFLKIDFPRVPYPENAEQFNKLTALGAMLRGLHLLENVSPIMNLANFPIAGTNKTETVKYKEEKVYVNKTQYFDNVPTEIAEYYIGGYQPAQKWLKDRREKVLSFDDIEHYQKICAALKLTIELQAQIDEIGNF
jgi:predicted helicase